MKPLYLILLFTLISSCTENSNTGKKIITTGKNGAILFSGEIKDSQPDGLWTMYDNKGKLVLELNFSSSPKTKDMLIKQYNSSGKIIYDAYYQNGILLEEKSCFDFEQVNYENGRYIFNHYLVPYYYEEFGKAKKNTSDIKDIKSKITFLRSKYKNIPNFTENEIKALLCYFNPKGAEIRP